MIGLGIDLIDLKGFETHYGSWDPELLDRCFTADEIAACGEGPNALARLAARMAAKEAVYKALMADQDVSHRDIEIIGDSGPPAVNLHGPARSLAEARGVRRILVSLSHSAATVGAAAVALSS